MKHRIKTSICLGVAVGILGSSAVMAQNVGIGTAAPLERLHVAGNVRVNPLAGVGSRLVGADANGTLQIIAAGTNGQILTQTAGGPVWQNAATSNDWTILGNNNTTPATNFMGSTNNVDVVFRTNNIETFRMTNAQRVGIGAVAPVTKLEVSSGTADAIFGHSNNVGGYLGYETNLTLGVPAQTLLGAGVYASNPAAGYTSIYAQSTGAATVAASISYSDVWMASYNYVQNGTATFNPSANYNQLNVTNAALGGTQIALRGFNNRGTTAGNPGYTCGVQGIGDTQNQDAIGVQGITFTNSAVSVGGYFEGANYAGTSFAYAYVGGTVNGVTARKIIGTGSVSEVIPTSNHGRVTLTAPESPEYWYQDYGTVTMTNGTAHVNLDPIMAEIVVVDANNPIRVFATPVNMLNFNGVTITNQTATGFDLVELNGGSHSGTLDYQLVLKPKTNFGEGRFPQAPGPSYLKAGMEPTAAKAANQPQPGNIFHWPADHVQYGYDPADMVGPGDRVPAGPQAGKIKVATGKFADFMPIEQPKL